MTTSANFDIRPAPTRVSDEERAARMQNLGFGRTFTEHMVVADYIDGQGWGRGVIQPYCPMQMSVATSVLHYGQAIFEGLKAYSQPGGGMKTFRPEMNAERFNESARRLAMPELPAGWFVEAIDELLRLDAAWLPKNVGESIYLRPIMIAMDDALGARPSQNYRFVLMASPSGSYFPRGIKPVRVLVCEDYVRAAPGGTGAAKCAGNYAAGMIAQRKARAEGCDEVIWLDAVHRRFIEEMGGMNICFVYEKEGKTVLTTPELTGTILRGVTRDSLLVLARDLGLGVEERRVAIDEWEEDVKAGRMVEAFACGTAAVITPIASVKDRHGTFTIRDGEAGPLTLKLRETLLSIQHGLLPDPHHWMHSVL